MGVGVRSGVGLGTSVEQTSSSTENVIYTNNALGLASGAQDVVDFTTGESLNVQTLTLRSGVGIEQDTSNLTDYVTYGTTLHGKMNKEVATVLYKGLKTDSVDVSVDNLNYTIAATINEDILAKKQDAAIFAVLATDKDIPNGQVAGIEDLDKIYGSNYISGVLFKNTETGDVTVMTRKLELKIEGETRHKVYVFIGENTSGKWPVLKINSKTKTFTFTKEFELFVSPEVFLALEARVTALEGGLTELSALVASFIAQTNEKFDEVDATLAAHASGILNNLEEISSIKTWITNAKVDGGEIE